jgi:heat-inducible transcriptional repressor
MQRQYLEFNKLIANISNVLSGLTNYTTLFTMPTAAAYMIGSIKLIPVDNKSFVMIIVTSNGVVKNTQITISKPYEPEVLERLSNWLNNRFSGVSVDMITKELLEDEKELIPADTHLLESVFSYLEEAVMQLSEVDLELTGTTNIFNHPEFNDIDRAKDFLTFVKKDNRQDLIEVINNTSDDVSVIIGDENPVLKDHNLSMVVSNYNMGDGLKGKLAIIGPTRMDYAKAISTLNYLISLLRGMTGNDDIQ